MFFSFLPCTCCSADDSEAIVEDANNEKASLHASILLDNNDETVDVQEMLSSKLWQSAKDGDVEAVQSLLASRADVNASDEVSTPRSRKATALTFAARAGHTAVVRCLLATPGIEVNRTTEDEVLKVRCGQTALHWAARAGHSEVVQALLSHAELDVNQRTRFPSFTPLIITSQTSDPEHAAVVDILLKDKRTDIRYTWETPAKVDMDALKMATWEANTDVVKLLVNTGRSDGPDINKLSRDRKGKATPICVAAELGHPSIVKVLLDAKADANIPNESGQTAMEVAMSMDSTETIMILLCSKSGRGNTFTALREAQILGNAPLLLERFQEVDRHEALPTLHKAVIDRASVSALGEEIKRIEADGHATSATVLDGGDLPAAYWAIEMAHWDQVKCLLTAAHHMPQQFVDRLFKGEFGTIGHTASVTPGERLFQVCMCLLDEQAKILLDKHMAMGAFCLLKPFCGSVVALLYFQQHPEHFQLLRDACLRQSTRIYDIIDMEVGRSALKEVGKLGLEENHGHCRQDDQGLLPTFKYFVDESKNQSMAGNHEIFAARSLALAALSATDLFEEDLRQLIAQTPVQGHCALAEAPPKTFTRMYNKLMNKQEHGDPTIEKPRPMRNVDVIRCAIAVERVEDMETIYKAIKSKFRILRVKNTHDPDTGEAHGGYRAMLLNFAYEPGVTMKEIFGMQGGFNLNLVKDRPDLTYNDAHERGDATSEIWRAYCLSLKPPSEWLWAMQGLWYATRHQPDRRFCIGAEVQIVLQQFMRGRALSHLLYKIARCETGPQELARDFAGSFHGQTAEDLEKKLAVKKIARDKRAVKEQEK